MPIPKIIHQTAKTTALSDVYLKLQHRVITLHSDWEYCFYDDEQAREFITANMPEMIDIYDRYTVPVQRADLFRIIATYVKGGFYIDMDVNCHFALDELCCEKIVFAEEKTLTNNEKDELGNRDRLRIANYMFGSSKHHPFWEKMLSRMRSTAKRPIFNEDDILEVSGPGLLTTAYHDYKYDYDITLLENKNIVCKKCDSVSCQFGEFASHLHVGSWRWHIEKKPKSVYSYLKQIFGKIS